VLQGEVMNLNEELCLIYSCWDGQRRQFNCS